MPNPIELKFIHDFCCCRNLVRFYQSLSIIGRWPFWWDSLDVVVSILKQKSDIFVWKVLKIRRVWGFCHNYSFWLKIFVVNWKKKIRNYKGKNFFKNWSFEVCHEYFEPRKVRWTRHITFFVLYVRNHCTSRLSYQNGHRTIILNFDEDQLKFERSAFDQNLIKHVWRDLTKIFCVSNLWFIDSGCRKCRLTPLPSPTSWRSNVHYPSVF